MSMELLLFLVWIHVYCRYFVFGKLITTQVLNEHKGESVTLTCTWNITDAQRIRVEWRKHNKLHPLDDNGTLLSTVLWTHPNNKTTYTLMNQNRSSYVITNDTAMMTLESITEEDEGRYVCIILSEIPTLVILQENGTLLKVNNNKSDGDSQTLKYGLLALICVFPVVIIVGYLIWKRKKRPKRRILQKTEQESMELHHLDGDNNDADESSSSSNSVTWAISTLYESFDYFSMKNKDEKSAESSDKHAAFSNGPAASSSDPAACCNDPATCSDDNAACYEQITACSTGATICPDKPDACSDEKRRSTRK
ncbi:uncharacterized protein LOC143975431 [Lithobates pipiens]